jgi:hypothetical protein
MLQASRRILAVATCIEQARERILAGRPDAVRDIDGSFALIARNGKTVLPLTQYDVPTLYAVKGEVVRRGIKALTGLDVPIFPKRRFQHGALDRDRLREHLPEHEAIYRRQFMALYEG